MPTKKTGWSPLESAKTVEGLKKLLVENPDNYFIRQGVENALAVEAQRVRQWPLLNEAEQALVTNTFPVIYGIRPMRPGVLNAGPMSWEVALKDGAMANEIRVLYVPKEKIQYVKALVYGRNIAVEDIAIINSR